MAITRAKQSSLKTGVTKYDNFRGGLPYTPTIGTATDGGTGTTVSVAFTTNNTAGLTYTALSTPGSLSATSTTSPITVTGLTSGTAYTFAVKATNSAGDSPYSAASNSVTPVDPASFVSIASQTLGSNTRTITFSSIPGTYQHLQLRCLVRNVRVGTSLDDLYLKINAITTNYTYHALRGDGSTADAVSDTGYGNMKIQGIVPQNSNTSGIFGVTVIDIHDYISTTKNKTVRAFSGVDTNGAGWVTLNSSLTQTTSAVTTLILTSDVDFLSGSTFALYGIKA